MNKLQLIEIHSHTYNNEIEVKKSHKCFCCHCGEEFLSKEVVSFDDNNGNDGIKTALCPKCKMDAVIGDKSGYKYSNKLFLELYQFAFISKGDIDEANEEDIEFINQFDKGQIDTSDIKNINKYIVLLESLGNSGYNDAYNKLGQYYSSKGNLVAANKYYLELANNGVFEGMLRLGDMSFIGEGCPQSFEKAYYYFDKASLLGSMEAKYKIAMMYIRGNYFEVNEAFGLHLLEYCFNEIKESFFKDLDDDKYLLADIAYDLGNCHYDGIGTEVNYTLASFLFYIALYAIEKRAGIYEDNSEDEETNKELQAKILRMVKSRTKQYPFEDFKYSNELFRSVMFLIMPGYLFSIDNVRIDNKKRTLELSIHSNYDLIVFDSESLMFKITRDVSFKLDKCFVDKECEEINSNLEFKVEDDNHFLFLSDSKEGSDIKKVIL